MRCSQKCFVLGLIITFWGTFVSIECKRYMRCELSRELLVKYKISKTFLSSWICLVEHESNLSTNVVSSQTNGFNRYGLFQINGKDWCRDGRKGGKCNMKCEDFLNDDISDDVQCAQKIFDTEGFKYWPGWKKSCKPANLPNLNVVCNLDTSFRDYLFRQRNEKFY